jgi:hypothetical protein
MNYGITATQTNSNQKLIEMDHYKDCVISATQTNSNHHVPTETITKNNLATEDILVHILPQGSED